MNEPTTVTRKAKRSFKEKMADSLTARIELLKKRLGKFDLIKAELDDCQGALRNLLGDSVVAVKSNAPVVDVADHYKPDECAIDIDGMEKYCKLPVRFSPDDLSALLDNNKQKTYQWIAAWKQKQYITTISRGVYERTKRNG